MPDKCVVLRCNNRPNKEKGTSLHPIPFDRTDDPEKRRRRKKEGQFRKIKEVCSKHFLDEDHSVMFSHLTKDDFQRRLQKDDNYWDLCLPNDPCTLCFEGEQTS